MKMERSTISSWVRQARYRAKNRNIYSDLQIEDVEEVTQSHSGCAYCNAEAVTLDHPFPLDESTPNVQANVLPCCKSCKSAKKNNDLVWMFTNGSLTERKYLSLLKEIFTRKGGDTIKEYVKRVTGLSGE
jgi:hypothetical protein